MISKSLSSDRLGLFADKLGRNAYITTLYGLYFFFAMTVNAAVSIQNINVSHLINVADRIERITAAVNSVLNAQNIFVAVAVLFAAVISAMSSFQYLNSKTQIDFYHSLPIKREKLFIVNYISGLLFFIIPYLFNAGITLIVIFASGKGQYFNAETAAYSVLVSIVLYTAIYSISLSAAMLCGNTIVAILGSAVFLGYCPAIYGIYYSYMEVFFKTFFGQAVNTLQIVRNLTPVADLFSARSLGMLSWERIACYLIVSALFAYISLLLYKHRRSEAAGKAIAFAIARPIIKYAIVFAVTAAGGLFFYSLGNRELEWLIFGFICGAFITHIVMEVIFNFDFKAIFRNLRGLAVFSLIFALCAAAFISDITGYDRRLVDVADVKSVGIYVQLLENVSNRNQYRAYERIKTMTFDDPEVIAIARELAALGVEKVEIEDTDANTGKWLSGGSGFVFKMKRGGNVARYYSRLDEDRAMALVRALYDSEAVKNRLFGIFDVDPNEIKELNMTDLHHGGDGSKSEISLTERQKTDAMYEALCGDIMSSKSADMTEETALYWTQIVTHDNQRINFGIYPHYKNTIGLLDEYKITHDVVIDPEKIDYITLFDWTAMEAYQLRTYAAEAAEKIKTAYSSKEEGRVSITDKDEIAQIAKHIVPDAAAQRNPFFAVESSVEVSIFSEMSGSSFKNIYRFVKGEIPGFVTIRLKELTE